MSMDAEPSLSKLWAALESAALQIAQVTDRMSAAIDDQQYTPDELYEAFIMPIKEQLDVLDGHFAALHLRALYAEADARARRSQFKVIGNNQA